jgi:hypothetical protein
MAMRLPSAHRLNSILRMPGSPARVNKEFSFYLKNRICNAPGGDSARKPA